MRKVLPAAGLCILAALVAMACFLAWPREERDYGLFRWDDTLLEEGALQDLEAGIREAEVTELYQVFPEDLLASGQAGLFLQRMDKSNVMVHALVGEAEWALDPEAGVLLQKLEEIAAYNAGQKEANWIAGVMVDVEPHTLDAWEAGGEARRALMESYLSGLRAAYAFARSHSLTLWVCVPNYYDTACPQVLEALVSGACDGVAVMNYDRRDEYGQMAAEVALAERYGKGVRCIYELQEPGQHGLEEIHTYAGAGLEALWQSAEELEAAFGYEGLGFAYHYDEPLRELLAEL